MRAYAEGFSLLSGNCAFEEQLRLRREVFVDRLGWHLHVVDGMEVDQFDTPLARYANVYLPRGISRGGQPKYRLAGCSRMLPTQEGHYLLNRLWPDAWPLSVSSSPPKSHSVWEVTRVAIAPGLLPEEAGQARSLLLRETIWQMHSRGVETLLGECTSEVFRWLQADLSPAFEQAPDTESCFRKHGFMLSITDVNRAWEVLNAKEQAATP